MKSKTRIGLFGCGPHTANRGVSALFASAVAGLTRGIENADVTVFDTLSGDRMESFRVDNLGPVGFRALGIRGGKKIYVGEHVWNMKFASRLGALGRRMNTAVAAIKAMDVAVDISGGDSFTDMYPDPRMRWIAGGKELILDLGVPLVLLPQTYGPFQQSLGRASRIVRRARMCWARDERSFEVLRAMLGSEFNPERHCCGVDIAFGLVPRDATDSLDEPVLSFLNDQSRPVVGLNVSGLVGEDSKVSMEKYGFKADYFAAMKQFLTRLLDDTNANVVLVPHVMSPANSGESDLAVCIRLEQALSPEHQERIVIAPITLDQNELKWLIGRFDWFSGTRMHATIASLSQGVPTATVSYSDKALGVFESCGQGREVFDPRILETEPIVERLLDSYARREELKKSLERAMPSVHLKAREQMNSIIDVVTESIEN